MIQSFDTMIELIFTLVLWLCMPLIAWQGAIDQDPVLVLLAMTGHTLITASLAVMAYEKKRAD
jgi:hypothetical protein